MQLLLSTCDNLRAHPNTVKKIRESIYVDDVAMGANDMREAFTLYRESKEIFSKGGFN